MVPHNTVITPSTEKNVIKVATKQHKDKLYFKRESIDTANIITDCSTVGIAARLCYNSGLNGYNDWFLPSQDELNLLYLQKDIIGGFKGSYYWSSTQKDNNEAWEQNFITGQIYNYGKYDPVSVRAIRAF